ncbi:hypothetical protein [Nocardioides campestrisoli]|uniref:hypothetical protein n=1 Tax=Nocardioides campestrisoli TaxID=2736757 RepID=UPI0015E6B7FE|nr:hypothetical protein [Nocardioides campestrisoli]
MSETAIDEVVADLLETGAHVDPAADGWIPPEQLASITATAREAEIPVHVVLVPPEGGGIRAGDDLLVRVHDAGAPDGLYVGVNNVYEAAARESDSGYATLPDGSTLSLAVQQWGEVAGRSEITGEVETLLAWSEAPAALGDGLQRVVEGLADDSFEAEVEAARQARDDHLDARAAERAGEGTSLESWIPFADDETGVGDYLGVLLLGAALLVAVSRFRRRQPAPRTFVLPESVLDRVRAAGDAELVRRARRDVLALGEAIDGLEMSGSGSPAWAAALDHYEAAGRVLPADLPDDAADPLDAAGAVVLATRGLEALAAAERGAEFTPSTPCFLNPLHGEAAVDRTLEHDGRTVEAPVCTTCRRDLEAGRRPDVLDVVVRGTPRHYFETDREPWASTGFGALEPDLVRRLHADRSVERGDRG